MISSVGFWLGAVGFWLGAGVALAGTVDIAPDRLVAVLPMGVTDERAEVLRHVLERAGYADPVLVPARTLTDRVRVVEVRGLPSVDECGASVPLDAWRARLDGARSSSQLLAFSDALGALVGLDADLMCLTTPPASADLFHLELALAEAHAFLAREAGRDSVKTAFHEGEATAALRRAANFGRALAAPGDLSPEVLVAYERSQRAADVEDGPRVVIAGPGARVGGRFNGRPLESGAFNAVTGSNLVQAAAGAEVTAAARLRLTGGSTVVWLVPDAAAPLRWDLERALAALGSGGLGSGAFGADPLGADGRALLGAAARLLDAGGEVVFLQDRGGLVGLLRPSDGFAFEPLGASPVGPLDAWVAVVGAGAGGGWSSLAGGELDGLGGSNLGVSLYGRVGIRRWLSVAAAVSPSAVTAPIPSTQGGGTLVRATVPARIGVRLGPRTRRFSAEAGLDAGIHYLGRFERERVSFLVAGALGLSGAIGPRVALRLEAWAGAGLGYGAVGGTVGVEGRL